MQKNLEAVLASFSGALSQDTSSETHRYRKSGGATVPAAAAGKRRTSVPDLLDIANMFSHPQEGVGALVDLGEDMTRKLGAGSMSGGGNVQSVQGIMDLFGHEDDSSAGAASVGQLSLKEQLLMLWHSSLYIWLTLALCSLYYVVTGTQFWITEYATAKLPEGLGVDPTVVLWSFAFTSVTAPVATHVPILRHWRRGFCSASRAVYRLQSGHRRVVADPVLRWLHHLASDGCLHQRCAC
jgi:hypothetical protein